MAEVVIQLESGHCHPFHHRLMPTPQALAVHLSEQQMHLLQQIAHSRTQPHRLVQRAQLLLLAFEGLNNTKISQQVQLHRHQVRHWRQRWQDANEKLALVEQAGSNDKALTQQIISVLSDELRCGAPAKFQVEQIAQIVALACELPASSRRPITHWTPKELADEAVKRHIVRSISQRSVGRFLKRGETATASPSVLVECSTD